MGAAFCCSLTLRGGALRLRFFSVLLVALTGFVIQAGAASASTATFVAPTAGGTISGNTSFVVDTTGLSGVAGIDMYTNSTGDQALTQYDGGWSMTADHARSVALGNGRYRVDLGTAGWTNPVTNDAAPYSLTFVAVPVDNTGVRLDAVSETVTIDNRVPALTISSIAPAADSTVSGTFTLTVHAADQNAITAGSYSLNGGASQALTLQSPGVFTASIDTTAIPNGDLYVGVDLTDEPGNTANNNAAQHHLVVQNPVAPTIVPNTLAAQKSLFRSGETQLEVGDIVTAYNMQADGYPAPAIQYLWNICHGQVCQGVIAGSSGDYTVQPADAGATLTLVASATNASGTASTTVDFGAIAPAYVAPVVDPTPAPAPAPAPAPVPAPDPTPAPVPQAPPAAAPAAAPVVTPPAQTAAEAARKAVGVLKRTVKAKAAALVTAQQAQQAAKATVKSAQTKVATAVSAVASPKATTAQKKRVVSAVTLLVTLRAAAAGKVATATAAAAKAGAAKTSADAAVKTARSAVVAAQKAGKKKRTKLAVLQEALAQATNAATVKAAAATKTTARAARVKSAAARSMKAARTKVGAVVKLVSAGAATPRQTKQIVTSVTKLVAAQTVASHTAAGVKSASKRLISAKKRLRTKTIAAASP